MILSLLYYKMQFRKMDKRHFVGFAKTQRWCVFVKDVTERQRSFRQMLQILSRQICVRKSDSIVFESSRMSFANFYSLQIPSHFIDKRFMSSIGPLIFSKMQILNYSSLRKLFYYASFEIGALNQDIDWLQKSIRTTLKKPDIAKNVFHHATLSNLAQLVNFSTKTIIQECSQEKVILYKIEVLFR